MIINSNNCCIFVTVVFLQQLPPYTPKSRRTLLYIYTWDCRTPLARHTYPILLKQPTPFPLCQAYLNTISGIGWMSLILKMLNQLFT